jgi:hypothetical protein
MFLKLENSVRYIDADSVDDLKLSHEVPVGVWKLTCAQYVGFYLEETEIKLSLSESTLTPTVLSTFSKPFANVGNVTSVMSPTAASIASSTIPSTSSSFAYSSNTGSSSLVTKFETS